MNHFPEDAVSYCEFCDELHQHMSGRFSNIYGPWGIDSRVVAQTDNFVCMPTLGQLFRGSLLLLPKLHIETIASIPSDLVPEMIGLMRQVEPTLRTYGDTVFFEHGAKAHTGGACGIYHAHIHLVPLPEELSAAQLFPEGRRTGQSLSKTLRELSDTDEYLLVGSGDEIAYAPVSDLQFIPGSQFFRRRLVQHFGLARPWDWRESKTPEDDVLHTLRAFHAPQTAQSLGNRV